MYKEYMLNVSKNWVEEKFYFDTEEEMKEWIKENKRLYTICSAFKLTSVDLADCF